MPHRRFRFLSHDAFNKLTQREKLVYVSRAAAALDRTLRDTAGQEPDVIRPDFSPGTLGAVLYANAKTHLSEKGWVELVHAAGRGDQHALHALYARMHRPVFTLIGRLVGSHEAAEELTLRVFCDIWHWTALFDPRKETVVGWIMKLARERAAEQLRVEERKRAARPRAVHRRPAATLQRRLARRIADETGGAPVLPLMRPWAEPKWEEVAPAISCKLLSTDTEQHRVSMLVRLAPGGDYPPHTHAGVEELHLLDGELWIDDRKLFPGDYNRAEPGTGDKRVWSETGCTCVLITSTRDVLA